MATTQTDTVGKGHVPKGHGHPKTRKGVHTGHTNAPRASKKQNSTHHNPRPAPPTPPLSHVEQKKQDFNGYMVDPHADDYDDLIKQEVTDYNKSFAATPNFTPLDWRWVKAMSWEESGPDSHYDKQHNTWGPASRMWRIYPLQIGFRRKDPGMDVIKNRKDHSELIASQELRNALKKGPMTGELNIRAGIAYLYHVAAVKQYVPNIVDSQELHTYKVKKKTETFNSIAKSQKTTVPELELDNPRVKNDIIHPNDELQFKLAHGAWQIVAWRDWQSAIDRYNGGGDSDYLPLVNAAYKLITTRFQQ
jgi:LysM repeat protein